jgi:SHS2 domain-containing protein
MPKLSVKEDVEEMFSGSDLSEEFKEKASTLFEAAVNARIITETARLEEEFESKLEESIAEINEELTSKVDSYLDFVVEQWMEENEVAIESALRNEITTDFINGLKNLFTEHYIDIPEDKISVVESLASKVEELEVMLDEKITENAQMKLALEETEKDKVFESYLDDLALSQQEKFKALAEGVDFDGDLEVYSRKLSIIKENYFTTEKKAPTSTNITEETFEVDENEKNVSIDPSVNRYVQAISRSLKK